jgi:hypothetical protein
MKNLIAAAGIGAALMGLGTGTAHADYGQDWGDNPRQDSRMEYGACSSLRAYPNQAGVSRLVNAQLDWGLDAIYIVHELDAATKNICPQYAQLVSAWTAGLR